MFLHIFFNDYVSITINFISYIRSSVMHNCGMYIPLRDDKHQMVRESSKKCTGQTGCNSNPVAMLPHATVVFHMQPFNLLLWGRH